MSERQTVWIDHEWDVERFIYSDKSWPRGVGVVRHEVDAETFARWEQVTEAYWALQEELEALHKAGSGPISDLGEALKAAPARP